VSFSSLTGQKTPLSIGELETAKGFTVEEEFKTAFLTIK
jgi:hypothetical protein